MTVKFRCTPRRTAAGLIVGGGIAVLAVMAAPALKATQTEPQGPVTFTKHIAPILQRSCQNCHRPEGGAPMSFITYEDARPWARAIKQKTARREMPPWYIEKNVGIQKFKDDPSLSDDEIATIATWADSGAPRGNPADMPPLRQWAQREEWSIGTPDLIVSSPVMTVQAVAPDRHLGNVGPFPTGLTEDRYIKAIEVKEVWVRGDRGKVERKAGDLNYFMVHHAVIADTLADMSRNDVADAGQTNGPRGALVIYELGQNALIYPQAVGRVLAAGSKLMMPDVHLHSVGVEVPVRLDIGFTFHPKGHTPKYTDLSTLNIGNPRDEIDIPAGQDNIRFDSYYTMPQPGILATFEPHMHASGVRMCLEAFYGGPTGPREMLNCAAYNHNWVKVYTYEDDVAPLLPKGTLLHLMGWYNNTANNPRVIDPRNWKGYGRRSIDDMFILLPRMVFLTEEQFTAEVAARQAKQRLETTTAGRN